MPRQISSIKAIGTVQGINFYQEKGDYLAREKPGVDTKRFLKDKAFEASRASSSRFGRGNTLWSLVYRFVLPGYKSKTLADLCRKKGIALAHERIAEEELLRRLHSFLVALHCIAISTADFELSIPILLKEADLRVTSKLKKPKKKKAEGLTVIMTEPPKGEDKEFFTQEEHDFNWEVVFAGEFHKDYEIPIAMALRIKDKFRGLKTTLLKPKEKIVDEWVKMES
jgi:hypothetical protein